MTKKEESGPKKLTKKEIKNLKGGYRGIGKSAKETYVGRSRGHRKNII